MIGLDAAIANAMRRVLIAEVGSPITGVLYQCPIMSYRFQQWRLKKCTCTIIRP